MVKKQQLHAIVKRHVFLIRIDIFGSAEKIHVFLCDQLHGSYVSVL